MKVGANRQICSLDGLISATRNHEAGITSNRGPACRGEISLNPILIARQW